MNPILAPGSTRGNNADGRVVRVLVMDSDVELTGDQQAGLEQALLRHVAAYNLSLAGHLTDTVWLDDGSRVEFTSNSGQHDVRVWPGKPGRKPRFEDLFFAVPGDGSGVAAWDPHYSGTWSFDEETEPPDELSSEREVTDNDGIGQHPGNLTWWNPDLTANDKPIIVSWIGRGTRYGRQDYYGHHLQLAAGGFFEALHSPADTGTIPSDHRTRWEDAFHPWVWIQGVRHEVYEVVDDEQVPVKVLSAGLQFDEERQQHVLFIITHGDDGLAVYSGDVDPYGDDAQVEHLFDIPFKVDNTPLSGGNPMWEMLQQPLYFDQSCTHAAGLVIVKRASATNPTAAAIESGGTDPGAGAYMAKLVQVDIDAETTTFTSEHASWTYERVDPDDAGNGEVTETRITYGAVDWEGDDLRIALCKWEKHTQRVFTGTYSTSTGIDGTLVMTARTQVWIYLQHDDTVLMHRDTGDVVTGSLVVDASYGIIWSGIVPGTGPDPIDPADDEYAEVLGWLTGSGYLEETLTDPLYLGVDVAAGDLRHRFVVAAEHMETGTLDTHWDLNNPDAGPRPHTGIQDGWYSAFNFYQATVSLLGWTHIATRSPDTRDRNSGIRYSAWREGSMLDESDTSSVAWDFASQYHSLLGIGLHSNGTFGFIEDVWEGNAPALSTSETKLDLLRYVSDPFNGFVSNSNPYALGVAFTPEGDYGFFNIGPSVDTRSVAHFLIGEDDFPITPADLVDMAHGGLSSPVFLYQVPTEYPLP